MRYELLLCPDNLEAETGLQQGGLLGNMSRISPVQNDSLCYLSSDTMADSYQEERELTVSWDEKKKWESDFPSSLSSRSPNNERDQVSVTVTVQT